MLEKEKKSQLADKGESSEKEGLDSPEMKVDSENNTADKITETSFNEKLSESVKDLWYMSETDAEINVFIGEKADSVTKEVIAEQAQIPFGTNVEEKNFADFFKNLTRIEDWYGDEEKETAQKFSTVEKLLKESLKDLKVFKVGQIEIDIYVVGLDSQNILSGIKTKAVET